MVQTAMSLRDPALALHIASGTLGLLLGPVAMRAPKRRGRHTDAGTVYFWAMGAVCASAAVLAVVDWHRLWWSLPIAAFSYANAPVGYLAVRIRWPGWLRAHIGGMGGSYIALTTALLVVNVGPTPLVVWFIPTMIGTPIILAVTARVTRVGRPRLS